MIAIRIMVLVAAAVGYAGLFLGALLMAMCNRSGVADDHNDRYWQIQCLRKKHAAELRRLELLLDAERERGNRWKTQGGPVPSEG